MPKQINFLIPDNIAFQFQDDVDVWDAPPEEMSLPTLVHQTCEVQYEVLKRLAFIHALSYILPNLNNRDKKEKFDKALAAVTSGLKKAENMCTMSDICQSELGTLDRRLDRIVTDDMSVRVFWQQPSFVQFYQATPLQAKRDMQFVAPVLVAQFKTEPKLPNKSHFAYVEFDFEYQPLSHKLRETYVRNVVLALNTFVDQHKSIGGAALVLKGRVPTSFLHWLRGNSPLTPSPAPNVEVIFAAPVKTARNPNEYWFSIKTGTGLRLKKSNSAIKDKYSKKIHEDWNKLRSFVVIDDLIREAESASITYEEFVGHFWRYFSDISEPTRQEPHVAVVDAELAEPFVDGSIADYRAALVKESESKIAARKNKALKMLASFDEQRVLLKDKVLATLLDIHKRDYIERKKKRKRKRNLYYLDCHHIIYDAMKKKNYYKSEDMLLKDISPECLDKLNDTYTFHRDYCFVRVGNEGGAVKLSVSCVPNALFQEKSVNRAFHYTLFNLLLVIAQLGLSRKQMTDFWGKVLEEVQVTHHKLFCQFRSWYEKVKSDGRASKHEITTLLNELINGELDELFSISHIHWAMQSLNAVLISSSASSKIKTDADAQSEEMSCIADLFPDSDSDEDVEKEGVSSPSDFDSRNESVEVPSQALEEVVAVLETTPLVGSLSLESLKALLQFSGPAYHALSKGDKQALSKAGLSPTKGNTNYLYFFNTQYKKNNIVKFIYAIRSDDRIIVAREKLKGSDPNRPTHSELANGLGVKAAGELVFQKTDERWAIILINNGSGHYRPPALETLPVARQKILQGLHKDITKKRLRCLNSLKPGMALASGWDDLSELPYWSESAPSSPVLSAPIGEVKNKIGPKAIEGFSLRNVEDKGNCYYLACVDQMRGTGHPFLSSIPSGTSAHDSLRLKVQGELFKDREWADITEILSSVERLNIIIAIIDTRHPNLGFRCYYPDDATGTARETYDPVELPSKYNVVRLAFTGNHYLSVTSHPAIKAGALRSAFNIKSPRSMVNALLLHGYRRNEEASATPRGRERSLSL